MGTVRFTVGQYGRQGSSNLFATVVETSGAYTSSGTASFVEDSGGDIELSRGDIIRMSNTVASWVRFGDGVAAVGTGWELPAGTILEWECTTPGKVSVIDG